MPFPQQIVKLHLVIERLKLKLSTKKCALLWREVKYMGHVVSEEGISSHPGKVEAAKIWPKLTTVTEVGLCPYYRRFAASLADIAHPLHQCTTTAPFTWTPEADNVFQMLKLALIEASNNITGAVQHVHRTSPTTCSECNSSDLQVAALHLSSTEAVGNKSPE